LVVLAIVIKKGEIMDYVAIYKKIWSFTKFPVYNGLIYHYTSLQGLLGILDNGEFWATKISFLNDKAESFLAYEIAKKQVIRNIEVTIQKSAIPLRY